LGKRRRKRKEGNKFLRTALLRKVGVKKEKELTSIRGKIRKR